jgi:hypothetical protein
MPLKSIRNFWSCLHILNHQDRYSDWWSEYPHVAWDIHHQFYIKVVAKSREVRKLREVDVDNGVNNDVRGVRNEIAFGVIGFRGCRKTPYMIEADMEMS